MNAPRRVKDNNRRACGWTQEEDNLLFEAITDQTKAPRERTSRGRGHHGRTNHHNICWITVSNFIETGSEGRFERTSKQCSQRWSRVLDPSIRKDEWTAAEDTQLYASVDVYGPSSWSKVAVTLPGRTDIQCRSRWLQLRQREASVSHSSTGMLKRLASPPLGYEVLDEPSGQKPRVVKAADEENDTATMTVSTMERASVCSSSSTSLSRISIHNLLN